jgi:hypothetical protein
MTDRGHDRLNDASRERLARLAGSLTRAQLEIDLGGGWSVASAFGHLAFWDRWQAVRLERMVEGGALLDHDSVVMVEHMANESLAPFLAEIPLPDAPAMAVSAAERLDAVIAGLPDALAGSLLGTSDDFLLNRHRHRNEHLDQVERGIDAARDSVRGDPFVERNAASRARLAAVVARLGPDDYSLTTEPTDEGSWTIAGGLGHVMFWDRSMEARWRGSLARAGESGPVDIDGVPFAVVNSINDPLAAMFDEWADRVGVAVGTAAVAAAESLDALIEANAHRLPPGALAVRPAAVNRWRHRESHLEVIERALENRSRPG